MSDAPAIEVKMLSEPLYLAGAREMVVGLARRIGFRDQEAGQIALATDEALANVINHGYCRKPDGLIWIRLWTECSPGVVGLRIVIEDEGAQIEPEKICGRELDDIRPGGLGVHIIREVMDQVSYEKREVAGMRLTMSKTLPAPTGGEGGER